MRVRIVVVVGLACLFQPLVTFAQEESRGENLLPGWSSDPDLPPFDPEEFRRETQRPAPDTELSVLDQVEVARYLSEAGISREHYALAGAIAQRMESEGVGPADMRGAEMRSVYVMLAVVLAVSLLAFAAGRRFPGPSK